MERKHASDFPPEVLKLFDQYVHGWMNRRDFLDRAGKYAIGSFTAAAMLESLRPNYAFAQQVAKDDSRIKTEYLTYPSPQGSGTMRGYYARPSGGSETSIAAEPSTARRSGVAAARTERVAAAVYVPAALSWSHHDGPSSKFTGTSLSHSGMPKPSWIRRCM